MKTRTSLTRTMRAQDSEGQNYLIEEYEIDKQVRTAEGPQWQHLDCLLFLNGHLVNYCSKDDTFIVVENNIVLKHVS